MEIKSYDSPVRKYLPIILGCILIWLLAAIDYLTGHDVHVSLLYVLPIALAVWISGKRAGILLSFISAFAWFATDLFSEASYSSHFSHLWNILVRLGFFFIVVYGILQLVIARQRQRELTEFVVHDLKSPLVNIIMCLEDLEKHSSGDERARQYLNIASISANRMFTFIHSILDLSRMESGKMETNPEMISVSELVDSSVVQVSQWAKRSGVRIETDIGTGNRDISTDRWLVVRILSNLLGNAIKVSPKESSIKITATEVDGKSIRFDISDQGPGIPKEWLGRVFDRFHQVGARRVGVDIGSGLGLTFCRLAAEALGGRVELESDVGMGTTATLVLPAGKSKIQNPKS